MSIERYEHHGNVVAVRSHLKGKHRDHCLCYRCGSFRPKTREGNCPLANHVYSLCCLTGLTLPVWECPQFVYLAGSETLGLIDNHQGNETVIEEK